ncbi:hypothetical protein Tco_0465831 [Tanacetum coccineum]
MLIRDVRKNSPPSLILTLEFEVETSGTEVSLEGSGTICALSFSLLLTPLCCDDTHDVTPHVFALAGCDRLVSEPMAFCFLVLLRVLSRPTGYSISKDPKEVQIEEEPLEEPKEEG